MTVQSDKWIKKIAKEKGMIKPFVSKQVRKGKISFGLSSYGYDARVSNEFKIFTNVNSGIVDPKIFKKESFVTKVGKECIIPPNSFALARTMEYFKIPDDVLVICLGKSQSIVRMSFRRLAIAMQQVGTGLCLRDHHCKLVCQQWGKTVVPCFVHPVSCLKVG